MAAAVEVGVSAQAGADFDITVSRNDLLSELTAAQNVVERKTSIPILSAFLLEASEGVLTITATDLDQSLKTSCEAKVRAQGGCAIPARKLYDFIKLLPPGDVSLKVMANHWVHIRSGRTSTKMVGQARANFPAVPTLPAGSASSVPTHALRSAIERTVFAKTSEESKYTQDAALLVLSGDGITMVATDAYRLSRVKHILHVQQDKAVASRAQELLIPGACLKSLHRLLGTSNGECVHVTEDSNTLYFVMGARTLTCRKLSVVFPNYERVMPKYGEPGHILDAGSLLEPLRRCMLFVDAKTGAVVLDFEATQLKMRSAAADVGETEDVLDLYGGPDKLLRIKLNGEYVADFLKLASGNVTLKTGTKDEPLLFEQATDDGFFWEYIVMPMRG